MKTERYKREEILDVYRKVISGFIRQKKVVPKVIIKRYKQLLRQAGKIIE
jgi:hypothetical protein|tara:strand:- start:7834 stop:7983 length:150 start_codon:yes stop_codon:yes gene_type:complete